MGTVLHWLAAWCVVSVVIALLFVMALPPDDAE